MTVLRQQVKQLLQEVLQRDDIDSWQDDSEILGAVPEFDSMAIVALLTSIEENYGVVIADDEVSAESFRDLRRLGQFC